MLINNNRRFYIYEPKRSSLLAVSHYLAKCDLGGAHIPIFGPFIYIVNNGLLAILVDKFGLKIPYIRMLLFVLLAHNTNSKRKTSVWNVVFTRYKQFIKKTVVRQALVRMFTSSRVYTYIRKLLY